MDYHLYCRCPPKALRALLDDLVVRADRFLETHPPYGYDVDGVCVLGAPDLDAIREIAGSRLEREDRARLREARSVLEWRDQPAWKDDPMSLSLLCDLLTSGQVVLVEIDGDELHTPESLIEHFDRKKLVRFDLRA